MEELQEAAPASQEKLDIAIALAPPPAAVNPVVMQDAERSVARRIAQDQKLMDAADAGVNNFDYLMSLQPDFNERCAWCMIHSHSTSFGHLLWDCEQAPKARGRIDIHMDSVLVLNTRLTPSIQGPVNVPRSKNLCFACYSFQGGSHRMNKGTHCTPGGQLRQFLWFCRADDAVWAALKTEFELSAREDVPQALFAWAFTIVEELRWQNVETAMINIHRVLMWFMRKHRFNLPNTRSVTI
jgi:hypothetical protein